MANLGEVTNEGEFTWESEDGKQVLGEVRSVGEVTDGSEDNSRGLSGGEGKSGRRCGGQSAWEASAGGRTLRTASS